VDAGGHALEAGDTGGIREARFLAVELTSTSGTPLRSARATTTVIAVVAPRPRDAQVLELRGRS
jgi:hypothetical protein